MSSTAGYIETDSRNRITLGKYNPRGIRLWIVNVDDDGTITLSPAVAMTVAEAERLGKADT